ncbi:OLC1v1004491C1 [Oldenlandia corymbosa var. corymbosa]|uniref:OLC1v1004491C1 n=1 Tax=Oldenlandia corymbosa var. corymbosa TaxID=529605 RepID=A0AAV1DCH2_OLDCO|nr:OLC1v1004491C1 [Oldenlandia corymbosa var. corymbosa]
MMLKSHHSKIVFLMFIFLLASEQLTAAPILSVNHGEVEAEKKLVRVGRGDENSDSLSVLPESLLLLFHFWLSPLQSCQL